MYRSWLMRYFFYKQKTACEMRISDWSSDVCSSDLLGIDTILEDGHLDREIAVAQHAAAMRSALIIGSGGGCMLTGLVGGRALATGSEERTGEQDAREGQDTGHQRFSALVMREAWRPVSRSRRTLSRW